MSKSKERAVWIPKSLVEIDGHVGGTAVLTLPEHVAQNKGLI